MRSETAVLLLGMAQFLASGCGPADGASAGAGDSDMPMQAVELAVSPGGEGATLTLADALAEAPDGAHLVLEPGRYTAGMTLSRPVRLSARGPRPILQVDTGPVLVVASEGIVLTDLVLQGGAEGPVLAVDGGDLALSGCAVVSEAGDGIVATRGGASLLLQDSMLNTGAGTSLRLAGVTAMLDNVEIVRSEAAGLVTGGALTARGGRVAWCGSGLAVREGGELLVEDGVLWANRGPAVDVDGSSSACLRDVEIRAPGGVAAVRFTGGSGGLLEDCLLFGTPAAVDHHAGAVTREHLQQEIALGVDHHLVEGLLEIRDGSDPVVRRCEIRDALGHGISVRAARGVLEDTVVRSSVYYAVFLEDGADPVLRRCRLLDSGENGLVAFADAAGRLEDCELRGNGAFAGGTEGWAQVLLTEGSSTTFVHTTIQGGSDAGVVINGATTTGRFTDCDILDNEGVGVSVSAGAHPTFEACRIGRNGAVGVTLATGARGHFVDCTITSNAGHGVRIGAGASPSLTACRVEGNGGSGVAAVSGAGGLLQASHLSANGQSDLARARGADLVVSDDTVVDDAGG